MVVETSRPIAHVARELNVNETTLGYWVKEYDARVPPPSCTAIMSGRSPFAHFHSARRAAYIHL